MSARNPIDRIRTEPPAQWIAYLVTIVAGLGLATVHWLGLVAAGTLVGLVATSLKRALMAGFGFGLLALAFWFVRLSVEGSLGEVLATGEFVVIAVVIGIVGPLLGSLVRGII